MAYNCLTSLGACYVVAGIINKLFYRSSCASSVTLCASDVSPSFCVVNGDNVLRLPYNLPYSAWFRNVIVIILQSSSDIQNHFQLEYSPYYMFVRLRANICSIHSILRIIYIGWSASGRVIRAYEISCIRSDNNWFGRSKLFCSTIFCHVI